VEEGKTVEEIYEELALDDIQQAADLLRPVYDATDGADGYVSLEVSPNLAYDTEGTIAEARRLFAALDRPNVMIKVPATPDGIPAIETLIGDGINVNVTLIFSLTHYEAMAEAYIAGLEKLVANGGGLNKVASVASFFVSRVDAAVDRQLDELIRQSPIPNIQYLQGKIAIANAKAAYTRFRQIFSGSRWGRLAAKGARVQRPLWASTSAKNPLYPDTLYVDGLIGTDTVNTVPPATLNAFRDHGTVASTLEVSLDDARAQLARLAEVGVELDAVTQQLQDEGVAKFAKSFESLMATIAEKQERLLAGWEHQTASLGSYQAAVDDALAEMKENRIMARIWAHDHTVWKPEPTEITNRLGWLHSAEVMMENLPRLERLVEAVRAAGYTHALLLGMGGSSLAPEVFRKTFGVKKGYLDLAVLDSTDPGAVLAHAERLDLSRTLFIVATKSGGTVETLSFFKFFYNRVVEALGEKRAGAHFIAITDPGSELADAASLTTDAASLTTDAASLTTDAASLTTDAASLTAERYRFRATFLNDPNIGGRYSALSYFGLVPAALVGVDVGLLLGCALAASSGCESCVASGDNPGARLGSTLGELAKAGRDKATFILSPAIASFGDWVEQLIAESTGKEGQGILPVVGEPLGPPQVYGDDRLFVHLRLDDDAASSRDVAAASLTHDAALSALEAAGHPVVRLNLHDRYDLGGQFFLWEMATAVAGHRLGINPFDQPNVEAAKVLAREMVSEYMEKGTLPPGESAPLTAEAWSEFLAQVQAGDYIALQAYLQPTAETDAALAALRLRLRDHYRLATTVGYGPRFLHSTGQLYKGDAGSGLFVQFTADDAASSHDVAAASLTRDAPIPDEAGSPDSTMTFGVLKAAQAMGDRQALLDAGRRVISFHLGSDVVGSLEKLAEMLS